METGVSVGDAMTHEPIMVEKTDSLKKCAAKMEDHHVGAMIINDSGTFFIVTEQDIVRRAVAHGLNGDNPVFDIMTEMTYTIGPHQDIFDALMLMREKNIRHLPVIDDTGAMAGLLTAKDILKIQPHLFEIMAEKIELKEEERKIKEFNDSADA